MATPDADSSTASRRHNILFTLPRTSSNLLTKILNLPAQSNIHRHSSDGYIFLPTLVHRFSNDLVGKNVNTWTDAERQQMSATFQGGNSKLENWIESASAAGKTTFTKEHLNWLIEPSAETAHLWGRSPDQSTTTTASPATKVTTPVNETCLPPATLLRLAPTFLIRNPLLTLPSLLRATIDIQGLDAALATSMQQWRWETTLHWHIALLDWYGATLPASARLTCTPGVEYPIILDADDIVDGPLLRRYARAVGLDAEVVRFEWAKGEEGEGEGLGKAESRMKSTLLGSEGIVGGKTGRGLSIETERGLWEEEFGEVLAGRLVELYEGMRGEYEGLWSRRFR